jgi:hypothetical protein
MPEVRGGEESAKTTSVQQLAALRDELHEIREMLLTLLQRQGVEWRDRPSPRLFSGDEQRILLEDAVRIVWGKAAAKDAESLGAHTEILKGWASHGLNGVVLETEVVGDKWFTSREAVKRFQEKLRM